MTQLATFMLDGLHFGVDVVKVQEVLRHQPMTRVPLAPPVVEGLIHLRGQIVTALDLRRRLALAPRADGELPMNVVVRTADGVVSLLVDEIGDVVDARDDQFEPAPERLKSALSSLVTGVYKLTGHLLLVLDVERAVKVDDTRVPAVHGAAAVN